jgi:hypothetical protein
MQGHAEKLVQMQGMQGMQRGTLINQEAPHGWTYTITRVQHSADQLCIVSTAKHTQHNKISNGRLRLGVLLGATNHRQ